VYRDESAEMTRLSTLPSTPEQAHHALLLLGVPASLRLVAEVHAALLDGDLSVPALVALLRDEERHFTDSPPPPPGDAGSSICPGLNLDLTAARGTVTLGAWPVADRICSPAAARADALAVAVRIAEIAPMRPGACTAALLRRLAESVPGGVEAFDPLNPAALADVARAALADPALADAVAAEEPARAAAAERAGRLALRQQLFGVPAVPHQRGPA
jgi:hypothetical protein